MKRITLVIAAFAMVLCMTGCEETSTSGGTKEATKKQEAVEIKQSPDKYTWYMQSYVGRNLASCGYTAMSNKRYDNSYGAGLIELCLVSDDGSYIDISDEEVLKGYEVVAQNIAPNTEIKYTFEVNSEGKEYSNLVQWQSIEKIDLLVKKLKKDIASDAPELVEVTASPDRYTNYVRNYVGKNLALVGYTALSGNRMDEYGAAYVELSLVADDGTFIDLENEELIKQYVVTGQDVAPNTQMSYTYMVNSDGKEYDNLIDTQSLEKITLYLTKLQQ